jgi:hypothetical protein
MHVGDASSGSVLPDPERFEIVPPAVLAEAVPEGRALVHGRRRVFGAASERGARAVRDVAVAIVRDGAAGLQSFLARSADVAACHARRASLEARLGSLRAWSLVLWVGLFGLLPWATYGGKRVPPLELVGILIAAAYGGVLWTANAALRASGAARGERSRILAPILFFPPGAAHVLAVLERDLYVPAAPLTLGAEFLGAEAFQAFARRHLQRTAAARRAAADTPAEPVWSAQHVVSETVIRSVGPSAAQAIEAPAARADQTAAGFCPVCGAEYQSGVVRCSDCQVELAIY